MRRLRETASSLWRAHQALPWPLRIQWIVPGTFLLVMITGLLFALPPGPLCDEGMILFMEGGCDMGESNVFFFSKLGLLVALTLALSLAWRRRVIGFTPFLPHFLVAVALAWENRSGGRCDTYYSQPNGSIGQMVVEIMAFAAVGLMLLNRWGGSSTRRFAVVAAGWHVLYVAAFYVWLLLFPHWTWSHTWAVSVTMVLVGITVSSNAELHLTRAAPAMDARR